MEGKSEYVSLAVVKELLETQDRSYRTTLQIFVEDLKQKVRTIRKYIEDVKVSLQFSKGEIQDLKKNSTDTKLYVEQLEDRVKFEFIETNMENTRKALWKTSTNTLKIVSLPEKRTHWMTLRS